jgi:hypothetical protein
MSSEDGEAFACGDMQSVEISNSAVITCSSKWHV